MLKPGWTVYLVNYIFRMDLIDFLKNIVSRFLMDFDDHLVWRGFPHDFYFSWVHLSWESFVQYKRETVDCVDWPPVYNVTSPLQMWKYVHWKYDIENCSDCYLMGHV